MNRSRSHAAFWVSASCLLAASALGGPLQPAAGPVAPTMKTLTQIEPRTPLSAEATPGDADCVYKITQPGSYYLTGNLSAPAGFHGIEIAASNVTIDLNGFRISGGNSGTFCGIISSTGGLLGGMTGITIRNGAVAGFNDAGIRLGQLAQDGRAKAGVVENIVLRQNNLGLVAGDGFTIRNVVAELNQNTGITVYDGCTVAGCVMRNNAQNGLAANGGVVISDCNATSNGNAGFSVGVRASISKCVAEGNGGDGISVGSSGIVTGCVATSNGDDGFAATGSVLSKCTAQSNTGDGFQIQSGTSLTDSSSRLNTGAGVRFASGDNRVDSNHLQTNTAAAIDLNNTTRNSIIRNTFVGHGAASSYVNWNSNNYAGDPQTGEYANIILN